MMRSQQKIVPAKARNRSGAAWMTIRRCFMFTGSSANGPVMQVLS